jgi:hypothetical protein
VSPHDAEAGVRGVRPARSVPPRSTTGPIPGSMSAACQVGYVDLFDRRYSCPTFPLSAATIAAMVFRSPADRRVLLIFGFAAGSVFLVFFGFLFFFATWASVIGGPRNVGLFAARVRGQARQQASRALRGLLPEAARQRPSSVAPVACGGPKSLA